MDRRVPAIRKDFLTFVVSTPNCQIIKLPKSEGNNWNFQGVTIEGVENFITAIRNKLLALGLSDYTMVPLEPLENEAARLKYSFPDRLSCLQFRASVLPDRAGIFSQVIHSNSSAEADLRLHNIKRFMSMYEIKGDVDKVGNMLYVVTHSFYHDAAITIHHEMGRFDEKDYKPDIGRKVTRVVHFSHDPR